MFLVDHQVPVVAEQGLYKLVGGHEVVKAVERDGVLHSGVMGVKGDNGFDPHGHQLFQSHGAVKRFPVRFFVLAAFVEKRHDHINPVGSGRGGSDDPL